MTGWSKLTSRAAWWEPAGADQKVSGLPSRAAAKFRWRRRMLKGEVALGALAECGAEFLEAGDIGVGEQTAAIGGEAEHELRAAAYGLVVDVEQLVEGLQRRLVVGVPEPVQLAQRRIGFDGTPAAVAVAVDDVPVLVVDDAGLVAHPACVAIFEEAGVGEDDGVGLVGAQGLDDFFEVVDVAFAAGAVKPELDQVAVVRGQFFEFGVVVAVVGGVSPCSAGRGGPRARDRRRTSGRTCARRARHRRRRRLCRLFQGLLLML